MQFKYQHSFYNILLILMSIAKCSSCHAPHGCWLTVAFTTDHDTNHVHLIIVTLTYMYVVWRGDKTTVELGGRPWSPNPPPPPQDKETGGNPHDHIFLLLGWYRGRYRSLDRVCGYMMEVDCINMWVLMACMYSVCLRVHPCHVTEMLMDTNFKF